MSDPIQMSAALRKADNTLLMLVLRLETRVYIFVYWFNSNVYGLCNWYNAKISWRGLRFQFVCLGFYLTCRNRKITRIYPL